MELYRIKEKLHFREISMLNGTFKIELINLNFVAMNIQQICCIWPILRLDNYKLYVMIISQNFSLKIYMEKKINVLQLTKNNIIF